MRYLIVAILALLPAFAAGQQTNTQAPDYNITVHVEISRLVALCPDTGCGMVQHLSVVIDGKKFELQSDRAAIHALQLHNGFYLLRAGDYRARILAEDNKRSYEYERIYELSFGDGHTAKYRVVGEGNL